VHSYDELDGSYQTLVLGYFAFEMDVTDAVIYAISTFNTSGLIKPPPGILAAAYVVLVRPHREQRRCNDTNITSQIILR